MDVQDSSITLGDISSILKRTVMLQLKLFDAENQWRRTEDIKDSWFL